MAARALMMVPHGTAIVAPDADGVCMALANAIADRIAAKDGPFRIALSGGSTPRPLYCRLAAMPVCWKNVEFYWGDERFVPHDHPDSNFRMARETLLSQIPVSASQIHPIPVDGGPDEAAERYEALLKSVYGSARFSPKKMLFDFLLLGIGEDGHTASLLPGEPALGERVRWVAAVPHGREEPRVTLTYPALESSAATAFLATGQAKAGAVRRARVGDQALPAGRLRPQGELFWYLDRAAAGA